MDDGEAVSSELMDPDSVASVLMPPPPVPAQKLPPGCPNWAARMRNCEVHVQYVICDTRDIYIKYFSYFSTKSYIVGTGCAVRLETRRSGVQPPPRSATFFRGD